MADLDPVIKTIIAEALGEGPDGMRMVGETILNRSQQRGIEPARVVAQPYQYTGYSNPGPAAVRAFNDPAAISAAQAAWQLAQGPDDPTKGANHYYAQGTISQPSWARNMTNTVTHGGHTFYTDRPFTQQSIPRAAPSPSQPTPSMAALRQMSSPTNGNTALQTSLNQYATRERNRVTPAIPPWAAMGMNQGAPVVQSGALSADQKAAANRAALQMNQSYVGQDSKGGTIPYPGVDARMDAARRAALSMGGNFSYAGNQGSGMLRNDRLPQGQPGLPARYGTMSPNQVNAIGVPVAPAPRTTNPRTAPVPANMSSSLMASRGRVAPTPFQRSTAVGTQLSVTPRNAPVPMPANMRPNVAPVPFARPNFGMGGPGFAPVNAAAMAQARTAPQPAIPAWASMAMNQPAPVAPTRPAVGTVLGMAGNGGLQTQGYGGVNNSITQKNFAAAQGQQINPNGTMSLMAGGGPSHFNGVATGGSAYDNNQSAGIAVIAPDAETLARMQAARASRSNG